MTSQDAGSPKTLPFQRGAHCDICGISCITYDLPLQWPGLDQVLFDAPGRYDSTLVSYDVDEVIERRTATQAGAAGQGTNLTVQAIGIGASVHAVPGTQAGATGQVAAAGQLVLFEPMDLDQHFRELLAWIDETNA